MDPRREGVDRRGKGWRQVRVSKLGHVGVCSQLQRFRKVFHISHDLPRDNSGRNALTDMFHGRRRVDVVLWNLCSVFKFK
ncbi:hypothetical protein PILCRDRAFT_321497 [Piloderma croceum F 1598]|uniref:Uncharacterized protein n=1 Tax=Piloderma croceum (strain F 1598) TaxID=765440 RepID=A0A0C3G6H1_PILCF|nr:hypothetical protein PILCRDRAFT_321497 [Piloderma croceum F 1598]